MVMWFLFNIWFQLVDSWLKQGLLLVICSWIIVLVMLVGIVIRLSGCLMDRFDWIVELNEISVIFIVFLSVVLQVSVWLRMGLLYFSLLICRNGVLGWYLMKLFLVQIWNNINGLLLMCLLINIDVLVLICVFLSVVLIVFFVIERVLFISCVMWNIVGCVLIVCVMLFLFWFGSFFFSIDSIDWVIDRLFEVQVQICCLFVLVSVCSFLQIEMLLILVLVWVLVMSVSLFLISMLM